MNTKQNHEGYLRINPGFGIFGVSEKPFESATYSCSHCQKIVFKHVDRTRERAYCSKCDRYICDGCGAIMAQTRECVPFKKILDDAQEAAFRAEQRGSLIII